MALRGLPFTVSPFKQSVPLKLLLLVPFVAQIVSAVGLVGYLSLQNGQQAVNDLAQQLRLKISDRVDQHLDTYLAIPQKLSKGYADAIQQRHLDAQDLPQLGRFFWQQVRLFDIGYVNYGLANGDFVGVGYVGDKHDTVLKIAEKSAATGNQLRDYSTDGLGNRTAYVTDPTYDHRREAWYQDAVYAGKPLWSQIYIWDGTLAKNISIAAAAPIRDAQSRVIGAVGIDLILDNISTFLNKLEISPQGKVFILERNSLLVASSSNEPLYSTENNQDKRQSGVTSRDRLIRATVQHLSSRDKGLYGIQNKQDSEFLLDGERQFVQVTPWRDALGLDWLVVITVPEADFMSQIQTNTQQTIALCILALVLAVIFAIYTTRRITRPIGRLIHASEAIAAGNLEQYVPGTKVREVGILGRSFNHMAQQLRDSFDTLAKTNQQLEQRVCDRTQELSQALSTLKIAQAQLIQTEKMAGLLQMVAGVAHEINNPISFIHGNLGYTRQYTDELLTLVQLYQNYYPTPSPEIQEYLDTVDLDFLQEDLKKILASMQTGTQRIREIVVSLRNFSRLDEASIKSVNIHTGIDNTFLLLNQKIQATAHRPEITIIRNYDTTIPAISCFPAQLNQVFFNILTNAVDAINQRYRQIPDAVASAPPTITIRTDKIDADQIRITISDNGCGIPSALRSRIFDPFFTTKPVGQGTGLGLVIAYQIIVEQHHGRLFCQSLAEPSTWVASNGMLLECGVEFVIELPLQLPSMSAV